MITIDEIEANVRTILPLLEQAANLKLTLKQYEPAQLDDLGLPVTATNGELVIQKRYGIFGLFRKPIVAILPGDTVMCIYLAQPNKTFSAGLNRRLWKLCGDKLMVLQGYETA